MTDTATAEQAADMETGLASNDALSEAEKAWFEHEDYADLDEDTRRIAPKYATEREAAKAGLNAQRLVNRKVNDMLTANPGLLRELDMKPGSILKELGAVQDAEALAEYGGAPAEDYCQKIKDSYDPKEEAQLKALCVAGGFLPHQVRALFDYREQQMRELDRRLREKDTEASRVGDAQKAEFQKREGWSGDGFRIHMALAQRAARQFGNDELADSIKAMQDGKQPFNAALVNVLHELAEARVREEAVVEGQREKAGAAKGKGSIFDYPEMDNE